MNTQAQHTPTPWMDIDGHVRSADYVLHGAPIYTVHARKKAGMQEANAAFILKACNAHDDLVGIVRDLVAYHDGGFGHPDTPIDSKIAYIEALNRPRAALAKAGAL